MRCWTLSTRHTTQDHFLMSECLLPNEYVYVHTAGHHSISNCSGHTKEVLVRKRAAQVNGNFPTVDCLSKQCNILNRCWQSTSLFAFSGYVTRSCRWTHRTKDRKLKTHSQLSDLVANVEEGCKFVDSLIHANSGVHIKRNCVRETPNTANFVFVHCVLQKGNPKKLMRKTRPNTQRKTSSCLKCRTLCCSISQRCEQRKSSIQSHVSFIYSWQTTTL